ncbi:hypothetical protein HPB47_007859 [Ixodes persulcatus]|uniref:Uncharacterized protein n=1 Tax=Ixodes persulcatus TaxID=34615 RepID=A0AC60P6A1_IXOPE|nr:hypothetical protein HPB47_007859 [Ixodes persulcatus]
MTRLSPSSRAQYPAGQIVSILGVDCMQLSFSITMFPLPVIGVVCSPLIFYMLSARVGVWPAVSVMKGRDDRLKRVADLLSSIRLVKMYAWEDAYMNSVKDLREKEMVPIFQVNLLDGFIDSLYSASTSVLTIILFGTLAALDPTRILTPALSFSCIYILSLTDMVTNSASLTLRMRSLWKKRKHVRELFSSGAVGTRELNPEGDSGKAREREVVLEKGSFAWTKGQGPKTKAVLRGISLDVQSGALVGVTGFVGSGKSSLLAAILGDMHCLEGTGKIGYVPQVACIYNMTVRDNIIFGQEFDPVRYGRVLRACELLNDINTFPAGDLTEVGEKGETLSGGQKQRISLARAAYSRCPIYLFDDPLSALDPNVADKVFKQVLGNSGLLKNKGSWQLMRALLSLSGLCVPASLVFFAASAIALAWQQLWIKDWTDANSLDNDDDPYDPNWVRGLVGLCIGDVLFRCVGGALLAASTRQLSRSLHKDMLSHVLLSPVSFFDSAPRARILNRFSLDLDAIDVRFYLTVKVSIQNTLVTLSRLSVIATQSPVVLGVGAVGAVILIFGMRLIIKAANDVRFVDGAYTSRVLQHVTETVDSLSTIRSYGVVERFCSHFCRLTDSNMVPFNGFICCYRISRFLASAVSFTIVFATLIFAVVMATGGASSVGLALSSSLSIPLTMMCLCVVLFTCMQMVVSFERALEYTELPQEPDVDIQETNLDNKNRPEVLSVLSVDQKWPTDGRLEFRDYYTSYRPKILPDVLKGVTFVVQPQEKVGIVGRTGAGKSSLVLALLRVLKSSRGSICIDGVDINTVPLRRLRNAVTVIPQDPSLVRGSLRSNLDPTESYTDEDLWRALREAHLDSFVASHANGLLMETGDGGSNLSVGQRQLVCLARALIRMPKVLLLDEATSQMDGDTDRLIRRR